VPAIKVTALSMVVHVLLLPVVITQSVPLALTCSVSSVAKTRLLPKVKLTLTALSNRVRVRVMVFKATFNNMSILMVEDTGVPRENHRPAASH
jgi:formate hydrogenlyase subunit 4